MDLSLLIEEQFDLILHSMHGYFFFDQFLIQFYIPAIYVTCFWHNKATMPLPQLS